LGDGDQPGFAITMPAPNDGHGLETEIEVGKMRCEVTPAWRRTEAASSWPRQGVNGGVKSGQAVEQNQATMAHA
jgi:hypothetical protein